MLEIVTRSNTPRRRTFSQSRTNQIALQPCFLSNFLDLSTHLIALTHLLLKFALQRQLQILQLSHLLQIIFFKLSDFFNLLLVLGKRSRSLTLKELVGAFFDIFGELIDGGHSTLPHQKNTRFKSHYWACFIVLAYLVFWFSIRFKSAKERLC